MNIEFKYPVGSYLTTTEDYIEHIDKLEKYIITENDIKAQLLLDIYKSPRLSKEIDINYLNNHWEIIEPKKEKTSQKTKKV